MRVGTDPLSRSLRYSRYLGRRLSERVREMSRGDSIDEELQISRGMLGEALQAQAEAVEQAEACATMKPADLTRVVLAANEVAWVWLERVKDYALAAHRINEADGRLSPQQVEAMAFQMAKTADVAFSEMSDEFKDPVNGPRRLADRLADMMDAMTIAEVPDTTSLLPSADEEALAMDSTVPAAPLAGALGPDQETGHGEEETRLVG